MKTYAYYNPTTKQLEGTQERTGGVYVEEVQNDSTFIADDVPPGYEDLGLAISGMILTQTMAMLPSDGRVAFAEAIDTALKENSLLAQPEYSKHRELLESLLGSCDEANSAMDLQDAIREDMQVRDLL